MTDDRDLPQEDEEVSEEEADEEPEDEEAVTEEAEPAARKPRRPKRRRKAAQHEAPAPSPRRRPVQVRDSRRLESIAAAAERSLAAKLSGPGAILGLVLLVAWLIVGAYAGGLLRPAALVLLILGVALVGAWVGINLSALRTAAGRRNARAGTVSAAMVVLVLGILVFANVLGHQYHYRTDLTREGLYSISKESQDILKGVSEELRATIVIGGSASMVAQADQARELLRSYQYHCRKLKVDEVDLGREPQRKEELGVSYPGKIVLKAGNPPSERREEISITGDDEQSLTSAIYRITKPQKDIVYFLQGHGELNPDGYDRPTSCSQFKTGLTDVQMDVKALTFGITGQAPTGAPGGLLQTPPSGGTPKAGPDRARNDQPTADNTTRVQQVPTDCKCLVIAGPQTPLQPKETEAIGKYLEQGGSLLAALRFEPGARTALNGLLTKYGVTARDGVVVDPINSIQTGFSVPRGTTDELLRDTVALYMPLTVALEVKQAPPEPQPYSSPYNQPPPSGPARSLLDSTGDCFLESKMAVDPKGDPRGPFTVVAAVDTKKPKTPPQPGMPPEMQPPDESQGPSTKVVVLGSVYAISDEVLKSESGMGTSQWAQSGLNLPFAVRAVTWLAGGQPVAIPPKQPDPNSFTLSKGAQYLVLSITLLVIPLGTIATGVIVWWRRR